MQTKIHPLSVSAKTTLNNGIVEVKHNAKGNFASAHKELNYVQLFQAREPELVGLEVLKCYVLVAEFYSIINHFEEQN